MDGRGDYGDLGRFVRYPPFFSLSFEVALLIQLGDGRIVHGTGFIERRLQAITAWFWFARRARMGGLLMGSWVLRRFLLSGFPGLGIRCRAFSASSEEKYTTLFFRVKRLYVNGG